MVTGPDRNLERLIDEQDDDQAHASDSDVDRIFSHISLLALE